MDFQVKGVYSTPFFDKIKCDHCKSESLSEHSIVYYNGNPSMLYHCNDCNQMVTARTDSQRDVANNIPGSHNLSFIPLNSSGSISVSGVGTSTSASIPLYDGTIRYNTDTSNIEVKQAIDNLGYKLDTINSNLFSLAHEIRTLIAKIDEAKLADPYANIVNRVKNFELK